LTESDSNGSKITVHIPKERQPVTADASAERQRRPGLGAVAADMGLMPDLAAGGRAATETVIPVIAFTMVPPRHGRRCHVDAGYYASFVFFHTKI
jgi:hypothetical protein